MRKSITVNDLEVAFHDEGPRDGVAVILAHCASASGREWQSLPPLLAKRGYRVLVPDFIGYGRSAPWPDNRPFNAAADVNILLALAAQAGKPVHLIGHSHGGLLALEAATLLGDQVRSLTLIEPTVFQLLHETGHRQWSVVTKMARRVQQAVERGDNRQAAQIFTGFWIGRLKWYLLPERHKRAIARSMKKVVLEFDIVDLAHRAPEHYGRITAPVLLIVGTRTRAPAKAAANLLHEALTDVRRAGLRAGHMSPFTHKKQINRMILDYLQSV